jgi:DNA invertase Pin-like site-specific DNA recombinase
MTMQSYEIALYIRLSMEDSKYDSLSMENQKMILNEFALSMPEAENAEIREFIDNGYSGTNFERPAIQELLELVRANKVDCIIVKDFSRFGRNSLETGYFIERVFPLFHTRFISISDDFDSNRFKGDTGGMDVAFKYLINEYYSRDMSVKTKSAKYAKMERGEYQSKVCPYGYQKSADGRMEPDPETADNVRLIFQLAADGNGGAEIARKLSAQHIPTPGEYKASKGNHTHDISRTHGVWCGATVLRILVDERYTGTYVIGKKTVVEVGSNRVRSKDRDKWYIIPDHHPAIVQRELFDAAQQATNRFKLPSKKAHDYPLTGKVFCGCCHHCLSRTNYKNSTYYCRHSFGIEGMACNGAKYSAVELEQSIFDALKAWIDQIGPGGRLGTATAKVDHAADYEKQLSELQNEKMRLYEQYVLGDLDVLSYKREKTVLDELLQKTKNAYASVKAQAKQQQAEQARQTSRQKAAKAVLNATGLTTELTDLLIDRVFVYPDNRIEITYKTQDIFEDAT